MMSVNPGFGGQSFIPNTLKKLRRVRAVLTAAGSSAPIEIDGGIDLVERRRRRRGRRQHPGRRSGHLRHVRSRSGHADACARRRTGRRVDNARHAGAAHARVACAMPTPIRWASSTTPTISSGSRSPGRNGCATAGGAIARWRQAGISLPVIEAHCEYRQPARYDDEIEIRTEARVLTPVRIRFDYEARRTADDTLSATGHTVHAALGADGRPRRLPARVLEILG